LEKWKAFKQDYCEKFINSLIKKTLLRNEKRLINKNKTKNLFFNLARKEWYKNPKSPNKDYCKKSLKWLQNQV
jgi:hypothetical protein